jgi:putative endopeptidase
MLHFVKAGTAISFMLNEDQDLKRYHLTSLALCLCSAFAAAEPAAGSASTSAGSAAFATSATSTAGPISGIDLQYIDRSVRAQDDFFVHLNGEWLKTVEIPADKSSWGSFAKLREDTLPQLRGIIEAAQGKAGSEGRKINDFYASFMDEERLEQRGVGPLAGELSRITAVRDKRALPVLIAHLGRLGVSVPYGVYVGQDARDTSKYAAYVSQDGLGLPDRDYYLDPKLDGVKGKYQLHIAKMLTLVGIKDADASAVAILALETRLAQTQWTKVENRDPVKRYNKTQIAAMATMAPGYDWKSTLSEAGVATKVDYVIVNQPSYLTSFQQTVDTTDLATWKAYFAWQLLNAYAPYMGRDIVDANFAFYGTVLSGTKTNSLRWKRAVSATERVLGEAVGKRYVAQYFPPERKERMEALVANLLAAYQDSIVTLDWMSDDTKREAQAKLAKFTPKIGYPNQWRDYGSLSIVRGDLVGNMLRSANFSYQRQIDKLGRPIDREEWGMTPQTVNAYYSPTMNEIVFPASILRPPFFDPTADDAVNYGAIGAVIGHEISHGFDDRGSQSDGDGNLRDWWSPQDRANFKARTDILVKQYDGYSPVPGYNVNGALTLGENIADNSGLAIAYKAYRLSLAGKEAPVIDGLTGEQRFYMGFGQVWRGKTRDEQMIVQVKSGPHSPAQFRANGTLRNQPGFYEAFDVKPGDLMYLAPQQRAIIW